MKKYTSPEMEKVVFQTSEAVMNGAIFPKSETEPEWGASSSSINRSSSASSYLNSLPKGFVDRDDD